MAEMPKWMSKHPCAACGVGYGECAQGLKFSLQCCKDCNHPTRWSENPPYSKEELAEMK